MSSEWKNYFKILFISSIPVVLLFLFTDVLVPFGVAYWGALITRGYVAMSIVSFIMGFAVNERRLKYGWRGAMTPGISLVIWAMTYGIGLVLVPIIILVVYMATNAKERKIEQEIAEEDTGQ